MGSLRGSPGLAAGTFFIRPRLLALLAAVPVLLSPAVAADGGASAGDFARLLAKRDALLAAVEELPPGEEALLKFAGGADHDDLLLTLRRSREGWREGFGEVPGWHQATMKDWRDYFHANFSGGCWRPNLRFPAGLAGLSMDGRKLAGTLGMTYRLDMPHDDRLPPGEHAQLWDRFIPGGFGVPRTMTYAVDAAVHAERAMLELVLEDGVYWDPACAAAAKPAAGQKTVAQKDAGPPAIVRKPIFVRLQVPATRFTPAWVRTPNWVHGFHEADTTGLKYADGRLTGRLVVMLHQNGWGPWGAGKHTRHEPIRVRFEVDARLDCNALSGSYKASYGGPLAGRSYNPRGDDTVEVVLPETRYEGTISGRGGKLVAGFFTATGDLGDRAGTVDGMLLDSRPAARRAIASMGGEATVEKIGVVLQQTRALHLMLQHPGLSYQEAWQQCGWPAPTTADLAGYLAGALRQVEALPAPDGKLPASKPETVGDSPSLGATPTAVEDAGVNVLPADAGGWCFLPRWQVMGPFRQRPGMEHDSALAPDLVVLAAAAYGQSTNRYGLPADPDAGQQWQSITCDDSRIGGPWDRAEMWSRYNGQVWYAAASLRSDKARTIWLSVEANDFAKLWVNDRLVWVDVERFYRYRPLGRTFVPVAVQAGENRLLFRVHDDRQLSWVRLAVTTTDPATPPVPAAALPANGDYVFPDARPTLAWDIATGVNVAWRNADLGGTGRPVVRGDAAFVTVGPDALVCVDLATGAARWTARLQDDSAGAAGKGAALSPTEPVTVGERLAVVGGTGTLHCFDAAGTSLWSRPTGLMNARLLACAERFVVEGQVSREDKQRGVAGLARIVAYDAATGQEAWRHDWPGTVARTAVELPLGRARFLLAASGTVIDPASGALVGALDGEMQSTDKNGTLVRSVMAGPYHVHASAGSVYLTSQGRHLAIRLWTRDDRLAHAQAWESNYGYNGFGNVPAPAMANERHLFTWHASLAHTPHCTDPRAEINVQDARDGRWLGRLKPVMTDLVDYGGLKLATPVIAGRHVFLLGGRSDKKRSQIAVVTADERIQLVARQDVEPGTTLPPVFAGRRMLLRSPTALLCVAATTPAGEHYETLERARMLLRVVGREPRAKAAADATPTADASVTGDTPIGELISDRATDRWLGAGPFPPEALADATAVAGIRPRTGSEFAGRTFAPLGWEFAFQDPPAYVRTCELQGTGDITPQFSTWVNPAAVSGSTGAGLLFTMLLNTRDRIVTASLDRPGVAQWLGGRPVRPDEPLRLAPGLYPYLLRVGPEFYDARPPEFLPPISVVRAIDRGVLEDIGWPKRWMVLGPLATRDPRPTSRQLAAVADSMALGGYDHKLFPFAVHDHAVDLGCLSRCVLGVEPDHAAQFVAPGVPMAAYALAQIECPADGYLYITASANSAMCWYLDGVSVYDRTRLGNVSQFTDLEAHPFAVRVTAGRHTLAVQVRPSSSGWNFRSLGGFSRQRGDQLAEFQVESRHPREGLELRLQPCFRELPHWPTMRRQWRARVRANAEPLRAIVSDLPGTAEAAAAAALLESLADAAPADPSL